MKYFSRFALRNISLLSGSQLVELFTSFFYSVIVVRYLGATTYGQLLIVISAGNILSSVVNLKIKDPFTSHLRTALDNENREKLNELVSTAVAVILLSFSLGLVIITVAILGESFINRFKMPWFYLVAIYFTSMEIRQLRSVIYAEFQALQLFGNLSYLKSLSAFSLNFLPLLFLPYGIEGICWGYLSSELFILGSYLLLLRAPFGSRKATIPSLTLNISWFGKLVREGWDLYQAKVVDQVSNNLGNIIISYFAGPGSLSFFNIGKKFYKINIAIFPALKSYLLPRFTQKWKNRRDEFFYTLKKYLVISGLYTLGSLGLLSIAIPYILPLFYGQEFIPSIQVFFILLPGYLISVPAGNIFKDVCIVTDNVSLYRTFYWITTICFLITLPVLSKFYSFQGAALVYSLQRFLNGLFVLAWFYQLRNQHLMNAN